MSRRSRSWTSSGTGLRGSEKQGVRQGQRSRQALNVPTLAAYPGMMQRARNCEGLRVCRPAWPLDISVREYRELEAGTRYPTFETWDRICKLYGWSQTFVGSAVGLQRWRSSAEGSDAVRSLSLELRLTRPSYGREWSRND
jgi:hypothetical protein